MITIEVDDDGILRGLERLGEKLEDMRPVMAEIGEALREASMEAFDTETAPDGRRWKPLSPVTIARRRGGPPYRILQDTGTLRQSITRQVDSPLSVVVGTRVSYGAKHQFGSGRVPARPFLGVSDEARSEIEATIVAWLERE